MFTQWMIIMVWIIKKEERFCPGTCQKVDAGDSLDRGIPRKTWTEVK